MQQFLSPSAVVSLTQNSFKHAGLVGPAAKLLLHHYQLDLSAITPTGPKNNLLKNDLLLFIDERNLVPKPHNVKLPSTGQFSTPKQKPQTNRQTLTSNFVDIPLSNMRSTIAKRLALSKCTIPHSYQLISINANNLLAARKSLVQKGLKVSINDFVIKAASLALRVVPQVNVQWKNEKIVQIPTIDVSVAVATPNGLITPIVFKADTLDVDQISKQFRDLALRARDNKLQLNEFQGGSFTISNLGMLGISHFTAIINPPQTAILAIGSTRLELNQFNETDNVFDVTLCYDARAINEIDAQHFLNQLKLYLMQPNSMIGGVQELGSFVEIF